ncbi:peptidoglycan-binding domain-containing protein [Curvivirga aplysinae]|uniref:peptidoglycan-binding domain-containing protein n=1 Tax=Curvivirga aplysinae TaxID=2529852 RepID=UPI0012BCC6A0|nr:peptidoglycan-binding domain-containing protein [Curvivirga aplysinae]MTI11334.1 peptidoglycan-binding protein [Curvivirga aplysinae]
MNYFNLKSTLSSNSPANPEDTLKTKETLNKLGYMEIPSYGLDDIPDKSLIDGIKKFQKDRNLKVDGIMKPGGETENELNKITHIGLISPHVQKSISPTILNSPQNNAPTSQQEPKNATNQKLSPICQKINEDFLRVTRDIEEKIQIIVDDKGTVENALDVLLAIEAVTKHPLYNKAHDLIGVIKSAPIGIPLIKTLLEGADIAMSLAKALAPYLVKRLQRTKEALNNVAYYIEVKTKEKDKIIAKHAQHNCGELPFP